MSTENTFYALHSRAQVPLQHITLPSQLLTPLCTLHTLLLQFFRGRQNNTAFQWGPETSPQNVSLADILVVAASVVVRQCSNQALVLPITIGRPEAVVADTTDLPSPTSIIEDTHNAVFQQMVSDSGCAAHTPWQ